MSWYNVAATSKEDMLGHFSDRCLPFSTVAWLELCAGIEGAEGQNWVLQAREVTGLWWGRQPAAGRPWRRHWMDRVWTPPPQDTEHWPAETVEKGAQRNGAEREEILKMSLTQTDCRKILLTKGAEEIEELIKKNFLQGWKKTKICHLACFCPPVNGQKGSSLGKTEDKHKHQ